MAGLERKKQFETLRRFRTRVLDASQDDETVGAVYYKQMMRLGIIRSGTSINRSRTAISEIVKTNFTTNQSKFKKEGIMT